MPYWLSVSHLAKITIHERLLLEKCEHFVKSSNRNRCFIASANGLQLLTIPIAGGRSHKQAYAETRIDHRLPWKRQHWYAMESAYGKSAFFEFYAPELKHIYDEAPDTLWMFNEQLLGWLLSKIQFQIPIESTIEYEKEVPYTDWRSARGPQKLMLPPYYQVFADKNGFLSDLSAMDLLFNQGPKGTKQYLASISSLPVMRHKAV